MGNMATAVYELATRDNTPENFVPSGFTWKSTAKEVAEHYKADLDGKVAVITGANAGIGYETARTFAEHGAKTYLACRSEQRCQKAIDDLVADGIDKELLKYLKLDLASLESVSGAVKSLKTLEEKIDYLVLNAGIMACPEGSTKDGFEMQIGVNHIGHYALATRLLDLVKASSGRIISLSSDGHTTTTDALQLDDLHWKTRGYNKWQAYNASKMANVLFAKEFQRHLDNEGSDVTVYSVHPGVVKTELLRHNGWVTSVIDIVMSRKSPQQGAATSMYCALSPDAKPGHYYSDSNECKNHKRADELDLAKDLWDLTEDSVKEKMS